MAGSNEYADSSSSPAGMLFIVSSDMRKADPATRKLIRSHAMQGIKKKRRQFINVQETPSVLPHAAPGMLEEMIEICASPIPGRVGSDLSFVEFAGEVEPSMLLNIVKVSTVAMSVMFPLMAAIGFQADNRERLYPLASDAIALHITAFSVEGFINRVLRNQEDAINPTAMLHFQKGVRLLRHRLLGDDEEAKVSDATMGVVLKLASTALFDGDYKASRQHMEGLRRMVDLREGLDVFQGRIFLTEMLRYDLSIALLNDWIPVFYYQPQEPFIPYPGQLLSAPDDEIYSQDSIGLIRQLDDDLVTACQTLKRFCSLVNLRTQAQQIVDPEIIHGTMTSVMYRLLHMSFAAGFIDEAVRLGLLAFSYHLFIQWQNIRVPHQQFSKTYQDCIQSLQVVDRVSPRLMLWLLMIGAISLFNVSDETWLRESLREHIDMCQVRTWKEMQDILESFMWIALLDEQPGMQIYNELCLSLGE